MQKQNRLIKNIIAEAAKTNVVMPWARGSRRNEWIAKRASRSVPLTAAQSR